MRQMVRPSFVRISFFVYDTVVRFFFCLFPFPYGNLNQSNRVMSK